MPRSKSGRKKQKARQRVAKRYVKAREDAQHAGVIETSPVGAVSNEVVDPAGQGSQPLPGLVGQAVRNGWATPDHKKPRIVDELIEVVEDESMHPAFKIQASRTLQMIDRDQWERDNPELAGKARGGVKVDVSNNTQVNLLDARRQEIKPDPLEQAKQQALEQAAPATPDAPKDQG